MKRIRVMIIFYIIIFIFLSVEICLATNELIITAPVTVEETESFVITVLSNETPIENVTVAFNNQNKTTDSSGQVVFYAPAVVDNILYNIIASKNGYQSATKFITVINFPKLYLTVSGTKIDGSYYQPIVVTVYDDSGNLITGATVTFDGQTEIAVNGQATFEITEDKPYYTIAATMSGFQNADPVTLQGVLPYPPSEINKDVLYLVIIVILILIIACLAIAKKRKK